MDQVSASAKRLIKHGYRAGIDGGMVIDPTASNVGHEVDGFVFRQEEPCRQPKARLLGNGLEGIVFDGQED